jgi:hypothetical protein
MTPRKGLLGIQVVIGGLVGGLIALIMGLFYFLVIAYFIKSLKSYIILPDIFWQAIQMILIGTIVLFSGSYGMLFSLSSQKNIERYMKRDDKYFAAIEGLGVGSAVCGVLLLFSDLYKPLCVGIGGLIGSWSGGMRYIDGGLIKRVFWLFGGIVGLIIGIFNNSSFNGIIGGAWGILTGFILGAMLGLIIEDYYGVIY